MSTGTPKGPGHDPVPEGPLRQRKPPSTHTLQHWQYIRDTLPFHDRRSFENSQRGSIASLATGAGLSAGVEIKRKDFPQRDAFNTLQLVDFLSNEDDIPDGYVNPSLLRNAQLNFLYHGLFEVVPGKIYQVSRSCCFAHKSCIDLGPP